MINTISSPPNSPRRVIDSDSFLSRRSPTETRQPSSPFVAPSPTSKVSIYHPVPAEHDSAEYNRLNKVIYLHCECYLRDGKYFNNDMYELKVAPTTTVFTDNSVAAITRWSRNAVLTENQLRLVC